MGLRTKAILLGVFSYLASPLGFALGLGEIKVNSLLNQPLQAEIQLLQTRELTAEEILVGLGTPEDFKRVGVDRPFLLNDLKFTVDMSGPSGPIIHVSSSRSIREPFLNFIIQTHWPSGKLLREYTVLLDLPVFTKAPARAVQAAQAQPSVQQRQARSETPAPAAARPAMDGNTYGPVSATDTLWSIASQSRPGNDVSMQQTMLAIQRLNPDAFINGNINLLKKGAVLRLPTEQDINEFDPSSAKREVASQNRAAPEAQIDASRSNVERTAAATEVKGRVKLSAATDMTGSKSGSGSGDGEQDIDAVRTQLLSTQEELASTQRENADLKGRVATMDEQIQTMEKLLEVANTDLRKLEIALNEQQRQAGESVEGITTEIPSDVSGEATTDTTDATSTEEDTSAATTTETPVSETPNAEQPVVEKPVVEKPVVEKPVVTPPVVTAKPSLLDIVMANALYIGGALLLLIVGVVYFIISRRNNDNDDGFEYDELEAQTDDPIAQASGVALAVPETDLDAFAEAESTKDDDITLESLGSMLLADAPTPAVSMEQVNALIEQAEYDQALELLNDVDAEPADIQLKRLEVFAQQNNLEAFDAQFSAYDFDADSAELAQAEALRSSIYGPVGEANDEDFDELDTTLRFDAITEADIEAAALESFPAEDRAPPSASQIDTDLEALSLENVDDLSLDSLDASLDLDDTEESLELDLELDEGFDATEESISEDLDFDALADTEALSSTSDGDDFAGLELELEDDALTLDIDDQLDVGGELDIESGEAPAAEALTLDLDLDSNIRETVIEDDSDELDLSNLDTSTLADNTELSSADDLGDFSLDDDFNLDGDLELSATDDLEIEDTESLDAQDTLSLEDDALSLDDEGFSLDSDESLNLEDDDLTLSEEFSAELSLDSDDESLADDLELDAAFALDTEEALEDEEAPLSALAETPSTLADEVDTDFDSLDALDVDLESLDHELDELASDFEGDFAGLENDSLETSLEAADVELEFDEPVGEVTPEALVEVKPEALVEEKPEALTGKAGVAPTPSVNMPDFDPDSDDDSEPSFLGDSDEVATKIDLLRVFVDMGDTESALNTLEEIREEGNVAQKAEAEALFAELS